MHLLGLGRQARLIVLLAARSAGLRGAVAGPRSLRCGLWRRSRTALGPPRITPYTPTEASVAPSPASPSSTQPRWSVKCCCGARRTGPQPSERLGRSVESHRRWSDRLRTAPRRALASVQQLETEAEGAVPGRVQERMPPLLPLGRQPSHSICRSPLRSDKLQSRTRTRFPTLAGRFLKKSGNLWRRVADNKFEAFRSVADASPRSWKGSDLSTGRAQREP